MIPTLFKTIAALGALDNLGLFPRPQQAPALTSQPSPIFNVGTGGDMLPTNMQTIEPVEQKEQTPKEKKDVLETIESALQAANPTVSYGKVDNLGLGAAPELMLDDPALAAGPKRFRTGQIRGVRLPRTRRA
tara:strand:+ start:316 stop:711 length:396 start_codon:yes stop_codon:yes gene_type:complete